MSVLSTLALLMLPAALKPKREQQRHMEKRAFIAGYDAGHEAGLELALAQVAQSLQNYAQMAQQNQLAMQNAAHYGQGLMQHHGLLGAQALDPGMWCNCVPSRAQMWQARPNDGH